MRLKAPDEDDGGKTAEEVGVAGCPPDLIIQPLISRSGDGKGETWNVQRQISKAIVWVCKPGDHEASLAPDAGDTQSAAAPSRTEHKLDASATEAHQPSGTIVVEPKEDAPPTLPTPAQLPQSAAEDDHVQSRLSVVPHRQENLQVIVKQQPASKRRVEHEAAVQNKRTRSSKPSSGQRRDATRTAAKSPKPGKTSPSVMSSVRALKHMAGKDVSPSDIKQESME